MTELAVREENNVVQLPAQRSAQLALVSEQESPLVRWVEELVRAEQIAQTLARTSFVPQSLRGKPDDIAAAILAGLELGLQPMATLRSMDVIQGTPALRAHAMRGLVQSHGHEVELIETTAEKCVMRGRRKGKTEWQTVKWDIPRATKLGLLNKPEWKRQPQTMLVNRSTGEICRLIASDVLYAMPYAAEELRDGDGLPEGGEFASPRVTVAEILEQGSAPAVSAASIATAPAPAEESTPTVEDFKAAADNATTVDELTAALLKARKFGFAQEGDELFQRFVDRRSALTRPTVGADPSNTCGFCMQPGHFEDDCPARGAEPEYVPDGVS